MSNAKIQFQQVDSGDDNVLRYAAYHGDRSSNSPASFADWILAVKSNKHNVAEEMTDILRTAPYTAFRFETPGVSVETVWDKKPFEFVLVNDPHLGDFASQQDPHTFAEQLQQCHTVGGRGPAAACAFWNLGGDARLVAPRNWKSSSPPTTTTNSNYHGHIANFMRGATMDQAIQVWGIVAKTLEEELLGESSKRPTNKPLWFSTAGDGVAWLHFRLDSRPKYYRFRPFKEFL